MKNWIFLLLIIITPAVYAAAEVTFSPLKPIYYVGECVDLKLQENLQAASRFDRVDLWTAVQLPDSTVLFMTPLAFTPFSLSPQPFRLSLESTKRRHDILDFEVIRGLAGKYTFFAAYVFEDQNPLDDATAFQSNLAQVTTILSDEPPATPVIDCVAVLSQPFDLVATAGDASVRISWGSVAGASSYVVYWRDSSGSSAKVPMPTTSYMHTGLTNGINYSYWITAVDSSGNEGVESITVAAIPTASAVALSAPVVISATPTDSQIVFSWQAMASAAAYIVYWQATDGGNDSFSISDTVFWHGGLTNGMQYTYWVTAISATGLESVASSSLNATPQATASITRVAGEAFRDNLRDGGQGPEMVVIPAGSFRMGDIQGGGYSDELPVHQVNIAYQFAMGISEVTVGEFRQFVEATGYRTEAEREDGCWVWNDGEWGEKGDANWNNPYFSQTNEHPVVCISWNDAVSYTEWLSEQTGQEYRLPSEAEWEYAARAGTETRYWWGNEIGKNRANCDGCGSSWDDEQTAPVGSFSPNAFGLYDTVGNVWEWCADTWHGNYEGAPSDGSVLSDATSNMRVFRGGSWNDYPGNSRSTVRGRNNPDSRFSSFGFRVFLVF